MHCWNEIPRLRIITLSFHLSHIQRICSRRLWKHTRNKLETHLKWKYNNWIKFQTWWQKEKLLVLSNIFFCRHVFLKGKPSAAEASESVFMRERVKPFPHIHIDGFGASAADDFWTALWLTKKLLIINHISFFHNVFSSVHEWNDHF